MSSSGQSAINPPTPPPAGAPGLTPRARSVRDRGAPARRLGVRAIALGYLAFLLVAPIVMIFYRTFEHGLAPVWSAVTAPDAVHAFWLSIEIVVIAVPLNTAFGIGIALLLERGRFRGKALLGMLIDLPFAISPVIAGLVFILLFGSNGWFGSFLQAHGIRIVFAVPGIVLATIFVTFPFVARELIPVMQSQGKDDEETALSLGADGWQTFWRVTLPNIRWGLLYGVLLCNARAMGEFGAVSVVSGHVRGLTDTMPLHVEILYNEYNIAAAFSVASLLALLALVTLAAKSVLEWRAPELRPHLHQQRDRARIGIG